MEKTTNIRRVMDRIHRHPLMNNISFETVIDYIVDFLQIVGTPSLYEEKTAEIHIEDYRGVLPCDFYNMIQVRTSKEHPLYHDRKTYRYTTDTFHLSPNKKDIHDFTYKIQGNVIFTSTKDTDIEISYNAIAVDEEGYPLIPDNASFLRAVEAYIKKQWLTIQFDMGKIQPAVLQNAQQEYCWAVGDCEAEFQRLSLDKAESLFNSWKGLLQRDNDHANGFRLTGSKEYLNM